ncbi:MAG TPA: hypothetical protein VJ807_01385 [Gaiellaceae bacterium]|nr:hypothetical protein [Gaiellaceae bacterium]
MVRALAGAVLVTIVVLTCAGDAGNASPERLPAGAASTLLPSGTRIVAREYREGCTALFHIESPPCLVIRFRFGGAAIDRKAAILAEAGGRWTVRARQHQNGWSLRFAHGQLRARAEVVSGEYRARCRSYEVVAASTCEDYLHVEVGRPAVFPTITIPPSLHLPEPPERDVRTAIPAPPHP